MVMTDVEITRVLRSKSYYRHREKNIARSKKWNQYYRDIKKKQTTEDSVNGGDEGVDKC